MDKIWQRLSKQFYGLLVVNLTTNLTTKCDPQKKKKTKWRCKKKQHAT
jgi:hypothetical protein